jgi:prolyl-tRNA synthetase
MKDAYSFDANQEGALKSYELMYDAYKAIFSRLGLDFRIVQADAGNIGGSQTHEFQVLAEAGEDALLVSDTTDYAANIEVCPAIDAEEAVVDTTVTALPLEKFATPGLKSIGSLSKALQIAEKQLVKTIFFSGNEGFDHKDQSLKAFAVLLRGSDEVNPVKVKNLLGLANPPRMLTDQEVKEVSGAWPGSCGPVGLKIPVYADKGLTHFKNFVVGANEDAFHLKNVNFERDFKIEKIADLRMAKAGDRCPSGKGFLKAYRGIEVGHVFYLGKKYSEKMKATFLDEKGQAQAFEMGCYGIGVSRTIQAAIEQSYDKDGIIWPSSIAPFDVHLCVLDINDAQVMGASQEIYNKLQGLGFEVLMDDRDERPGVKFKDADLIGLPIRLVVGKKGLDNGEIEFVERKTKAMKKIKVDEVLGAVQSYLKK